MPETIVFAKLKALLGPVLNVLVNTEWNRNSNINEILEGLASKLNGMHIKDLVEEAKGILDEGKGHDLKKLKNLATILTEGEIYGDIIKYASNHIIEGNINIKWDILQKELKKLEEKFNDLISEPSEKPSENKKDKKPESQSSGPEKAGEMPPHNVRRLLLYLSRFPEKYVFNYQRISRLLVAHEFIAAESDEPPLRHLTNWLEPAESSWDGDGAQNHFLIHNNVIKFKPTWPENHNLVREALVESIASFQYEIFRYSLVFLCEIKCPLDLKLNNGQFPFLKVLSLRYGMLKNEDSLKTLSFLKYLDLKYTTIKHGCSWLEGLEELEMLDLRYTDVEEIPEKCLEKLGKLQHLLLGYRPNKDENWLAGATLNTTKLTTNRLKTLRAIRCSNVIKASPEVADLSVTGLKTRDLKETEDGKSFWHAVVQFKNLTRLGVAMTKGSEITLQSCPPELKNKLKRLRIEGSHSGLEELSEFVNLVDLTLASHQRINIDSIRKLQNLVCLRLYGFCEEKTLKLSVNGFTNLKKLVIGDMGEVETVEITCDAIETANTLKICNLPKLSELNYRDPKSKHLLLKRRREGETVRRHMKSGTEVHKSIFLRGFEKNNFHERRGLKIYYYDKNKQCYQ